MPRSRSPQVSPREGPLPGSGAVLDGVSALIAAGLANFTADVVVVALPSGSRRHRLPGVVVRRPVRRVLHRGGGLPRTVPELATVHAAQWARTDRQAALLVAMAVQQRLVQQQRLLAQWSAVQRSPRRALLDVVVRDVCLGAHSLGELDFGGLCRRYRLPQPSRQMLRTGPDGRVYLDVYWEELGVVVEVEGAHHTQGLTAVSDALRQNALSLEGDVVLRVPVLGLRLEPDTFMRQVASALERACSLSRSRSRQS